MKHLASVKCSMTLRVYRAQLYLYCPCAAGAAEEKLPNHSSKRRAGAWWDTQKELNQQLGATRETQNLCLEPASLIKTLYHPNNSARLLHFH